MDIQNRISVRIIYGWFDWGLNFVDKILNIVLINLLKAIQMNLIDFFHSQQKIFKHLKDHQNNYNYQNHILPKHQLQLFQQFYKKITPFLNFTLLSLKQLQIQIFAQIFLDFQSSKLIFKFIIIKQQILTFQILYQKILIIRFLLNLNSNQQNIVLKIQPTTGYFRIQKQFLLSQFSIRSVSQMSQMIENTLDIMKKQVIVSYKSMIYFLNQKYQSINHDEEQTISMKFLKQTKKYIINSNFYAWKILQGQTENHKKQTKKYTYTTLKQQYLAYFTQSIFTPFSYFIPFTYHTQIPKIEEFTHLSFIQDEALKSHYLPLPCVRKQFKIINQITVMNESIQAKKQSGQVKLQTLEFGNINLQLTKYKTGQIQYERQILSQLPPQEFIGLPKYYYIKDSIINKQNIIFTNLNKSKTYGNFLKSNQTTISIITKLYMLNQVTLTLKYLRDHLVVYHNLRPSEIFIKKGLILKLRGFTNSHHSQVLVPQYQTYKNIFPFVSIYKFGKNKTYDDQRSDVYSLGVLIFLSLFNQIHCNVKDSTLINLNLHQCYKKYQNLSLFCLERFNSPSNLIIKLLTNLSFKATSHQIIKQSYKENDTKRKVLITNRPYLDWMVIIIRHILTFYQILL